MNIWGKDSEKVVETERLLPISTTCGNLVRNLSIGASASLRHLYLYHP